MKLRMYKIFKLVEGKRVHIGNVRAKDSTHAKRIYTKQSGLPSRYYIRYMARLI
jgi:hypothetical protein